MPGGRPRKADDGADAPAGHRTYWCLVCGRVLSGESLALTTRPRQAVARGRAVGPHPGRVDVRGKAGASRAIQAALRDATGRSPAALAAVLAAMINEGDPLRDLHPLFDLPEHPTGTSGVRGGGVPGCRRSGRVAGAGGAAGTGRVVAAARRVAPHRRPADR